MFSVVLDCLPTEGRVSKSYDAPGETGMGVLGQGWTKRNPLPRKHQSRSTCLKSAPGVRVMWNHCMVCISN